jgi:ABC-2 type transport system permease protein
VRELRIVAAVTLKDLRLIVRDRFAAISLLGVPIVVILAIASATQFGAGSKSILFPVVNEDQGPAATALIRELRKHLDVREVDLPAAERLVADQNQAAAALVLPREMSKRYLRDQTSTIELLTDPASWQQLQAIKISMLLAERELASLADPFHHDLLNLNERSITSGRLVFSSLQQSVPGFSLMFVLLTLVFSVPLDVREEEVWGTSKRLAAAPAPTAAILAAKLLARIIIGTGQLLVLLLFGHLVFGLPLGNSPLTLLLVAAAIVFSMACFASIVACLIRTREQIIPLGLALVFVLATLGGLFWPLYNLPLWMQRIADGAVTTWSMTALQDVILRGKSLAATWKEIMLLLVYGSLSFGLGLALFGYEERGNQ